MPKRSGPRLIRCQLSARRDICGAAAGWRWVTAAAHKTMIRFQSEASHKPTDKRRNDNFPPAVTDKHMIEAFEGLQKEERCALSGCPFIAQSFCITESFLDYTSHRSLNYSCRNEHVEEISYKATQDICALKGPFFFKCW